MIRFIFKQENKITLIAFILIAAGLILRFTGNTDAGNCLNRSNNYRYAAYRY